MEPLTIQLDLIVKLDMLYRVDILLEYQKPGLDWTKVDALAELRDQLLLDRGIFNANCIQG